MPLFIIERPVVNMISLKELIELEPDLVKKITAWYNDPLIACFIHPNFEEKPMTAMDENDTLKALSPKDHTYRYIVYDDATAIGEVSLTRDFHWLVKSEPKTAWISILIGDQSYWRQGAASQAMSLLEDIIRQQGYQRIELGVFANNVKAQGLYQKLGYTPCAVIPHFTFIDGIWVDDIRMDKFL